MTPRIVARYRPQPSKDHAIAMLAVFLGTVGLTTWMGTLPGEAAFLLGIGFAQVIGPVLRWMRG